MALARNEKTCRALLKDCGATLLRDKKHEVWELPNGIKFTCNKVGRGNRDAWRRDLSRLKRLLNGRLPENYREGNGDVDQEAADEALRARRKASKAAMKLVKPLPNPNQTKEKKMADAPARLTSAFVAFVPWTEEQLEVLKTGVELNMGWSEIAKELAPLRPGITARACQQKARKAGLYQTSGKPRGVVGTRWTDEEDGLLIEAHTKGWPPGRIHKSLRRKGVKRSLSGIKNRIVYLRKSGRLPGEEHPARPQAPAPVVRSAPAVDPSMLVAARYIDKEALAEDLGWVFHWAENETQEGADMLNSPAYSIIQSSKRALESLLGIRIPDHIPE